jgi:hypothetical protein
MIEGLERVCHLIGHCAILEDLYLRHVSRATDELKENLIRLYSSLLIFLGTRGCRMSRAAVE